jgi:hypothetical protein
LKLPQGREVQQVTLPCYCAPKDQKAQRNGWKVKTDMENKKSIWTLYQMEKGVWTQGLTLARQVI